MPDLSIYLMLASAASGAWAYYSAVRGEDGTSTAIKGVAAIMFAVGSILTWQLEIA